MRENHTAPKFFDAHAMPCLVLRCDVMRCDTIQYQNCYISRPQKANLRLIQLVNTPSNVITIFTNSDSNNAYESPPGFSLSRPAPSLSFPSAISIESPTPNSLNLVANNPSAGDCFPSLSGVLTLVGENPSLP